MMFYSLAGQVTGGGFAPSPLVLLQEKPQYGILMEKSDGSKPP